MATYTTNYNLEKPAQTDIYNVDVFNDNADKIDAGLTDKAEKTMLAPVETTNSASRSYAKGEYFVYNNVLCCATTAIAAGGTIAIGTNCSTAPVGGELKSLRDALTTTNLSSCTSSAVTFNPCVLVKSGNVCFLSFSITVTANVARWGSIMELPTDVIPKNTFYGFMTKTNTNNCIRLYTNQTRIVGASVAVAVGEQYDGVIVFAV